MVQNETGNRQWQWVVTSAVLLTIYLSFFHLCLHAEYWQCNILGVLGCIAWSAVCHFRRSVFLNRFEYWVHQLVGIDILLEGFSPLHEGLGFYFCAAGFWGVFLAYRSAFAWRRSSQTVFPELPATS